MRHPISSAAAAAIFVLAVTGVAVWFHGSGATPAFADFLEPILEAKTVRYKVTTEMKGPPATNLTTVVMMLDATRSRWEMEVEMPDKSKFMTVKIRDGGLGKTLMLQPAEKRATVYNDANIPEDRKAKPDDPFWFRSLLLDARDKPDVKREPLGEKDIDGRRVVGIRLSLPAAVFSVWGDPKTGLPARIEATVAIMPNVKMTMSDFAFNVDMDESLFSVEPPAGYKVTVVQDRSSDDSPEAEKDLIAMFRCYSQWSGGRFPDLLDMQWLHEVVSRADWLARGLAPQHKPMEKVDQEMDEAQEKLQRGMTFTLLLPEQSDWHYAGRGVSLGAADTPVFWYRPKDATTYRVIYADLSVHQSDTPPRVPAVPVAQLEKDLLEMFRQYSELNRGYFPDALDMRSVSQIVWRERQRKNNSEEPPQKPSAKEEQEVAEALVKLQRGVMFIGLLPKEADWHYAGKNVRLGIADRPIFWYRPEGAKTYRAVYADLSVRDADTPPSMPVALPEPGWPQGDCTIAGKVVAAATGKPVPNARVYLYYHPTPHGMFVNTDSDGTFSFKNIRTGPYALQTMVTPGYQEAHYDPEHKGDESWQFSLNEGEQRSDIVLKVKEACRISGKVVDENGKVPEDANHLSVMAWFKADDREGYASQYAEVERSDCSYVIDGLGDKPAYVMVENERAAKEGHGMPPIYYPGTFSRSEAKLVTFEKGRSVENVNITRRKEGGLAIAGTVRDEAGKPVPEAFVVVLPRDMYGGYATAYSDSQGHYQIQGLGDGEFLVHVDAVHRGLVRTRTPIRLDKTTKKTDLNFTLNPGVTISGKLVDENGRDWEVDFTAGSASVAAGKEKKGFAPTNVDFRNKYRPRNSDGIARGWFDLGKGDYLDGELIFPTKSTFIVQGMMPGHTTFQLYPQKVAKILHAGQDILDSGIDTEPGQEIKDITIVIAKQ